MNTASRVSFLLQRFFTERLINQRNASPHTIACYRDTFRLLFEFVQRQKQREPAQLTWEGLDAPLICAFLDHCEKDRHNTARTRNLRLTAMRSFFRYVSFQEPAEASRIQQVLAIPNKRQSRRLIGFLTYPEVEALLAAPDQHTWSGRRDYAFLLLTVQTGLRLSEVTGLHRQDVVLGTGAHVYCLGKGRKERRTPLAKRTVAALSGWLREPPRGEDDFLFPNARGGRLSADGAQYLLAKHLATARQNCPSLREKRVTLHVLRHTTAMALLQGGVDTSSIALWLGHESPATTHIYLDANLALKEQILAKVGTWDGTKTGRYRPEDPVLRFLKSL
jgi:site-specific recombinase XerD